MQEEAIRQNLQLRERQQSRKTVDTELAQLKQQNQELNRETKQRELIMKQARELYDQFQLEKEDHERQQKA